VPPIFGLIADAGEVPAEEMWEVFNMGCGMCAIVPAERAAEATALLGRHHPGAAVIGRLTGSEGEVSLPAAGLTLRPDTTAPRPEHPPH
jgi:phosphoribosylformylglycinamidine cyclo-ligase